MFLLFCIIDLGLMSSGWWFFNGLPIACRGVGLTGAVVGFLTSLAGIAWMLLDVLWEFSLMKMILSGACLFVAVFCFVAFIMTAVVSAESMGISGGLYGAGSAFLFFTFIIALGVGFLTFRVIDGATGGISLPSFGGSSKGDDSARDPDKPMEISGPH